VVTIEHNLDVIKTADWVIDLGPEGGERGGRVVAVGPPETIARTAKSYTGKWLASILPGNGNSRPQGSARAIAAPARAENAAASTRGRTGTNAGK
jgi:excinuclease ABC subunit A